MSKSMSDLSGEFAYVVDTVNSWRLVGHTVVWADSAQQVLEHALSMGYVKVDVAPAAPVNGCTGLPYKSGDTASHWPN